MERRATPHRAHGEAPGRQAAGVRTGTTGSPSCSSHEKGKAGRLSSLRIGQLESFQQALGQDPVPSQRVLDSGMIRAENQCCPEHKARGRQRRGWALEWSVSIRKARFWASPGRRSPHSARSQCQSIPKTENKTSSHSCLEASVCVSNHNDGRTTTLDHKLRRPQEPGR